MARRKISPEKQKAIDITENMSVVAFAIFWVSLLASIWIDVIRWKLFFTAIFMAIFSFLFHQVAKEFKEDFNGKN